MRFLSVYINTCYIYVYLKYYPNFAVSGLMRANCILLLVTSMGYDTDWAMAPAKPPQSSLAGMAKTSPPEKRENLKRLFSLLYRIAKV